MLFLRYFSIKDDDVTNLLQWGNDLMADCRRYIGAMRKENLIVKFMVISAEKIDDNHEFVIEGTVKNAAVKHGGKHAKPHKLLTEVTQDAPGNNLAGAVVVYWLVN